MLASRLNNPDFIRLQNDLFEVNVVPTVGAKIFDLIERRTGHNFLWHNPCIVPQPYPIEANFDNYWCGGWDDGFPTCEACTRNGEQYPNLGELRSLHWTVEAQDESSVTLSACGPISPVKVQKRTGLQGIVGQANDSLLGQSGQRYSWHSSQRREGQWA